MENSKEYYLTLGDEMYEALEIRTRTYRFKSYEKTFLGTEAVKWLSEKIGAGIPVDIEKALEVGNEMLAHGVFIHCRRDH